MCQRQVSSASHLLCASAQVLSETQNCLCSKRFFKQFCLLLSMLVLKCVPVVFEKSSKKMHWIGRPMRVDRIRETGQHWFLWSQMAISSTLDIRNECRWHAKRKSRWERLLQQKICEPCLYAEFYWKWKAGRAMVHGVGRIKQNYGPNRVPSVT